MPSKSVAGQGLGLLTDFLDTLRVSVRRQGGTDADLECLRDKSFVIQVAALVMEFKESRPFKTVTLGNYDSPKAYLRVLESVGVRMHPTVETILDRTPVATKPVDVDLYVMYGADLGFTKAPRREAVYARALERGFQVCPAEVGLALPLAFLDQLVKPSLTVAMEPIKGSDGILRIFNLGDGEKGRWLMGEQSEIVHTLRYDTRWVFTKSRS